MSFRRAWKLLSLSPSVGLGHRCDLARDPELSWHLDASRIRRLSNKSISIAAASDLLETIFSLLGISTITYYTLLGLNKNPISRLPKNFKNRLCLPRRLSHLLISSHLN